MIDEVCCRSTSCAIHIVHCGGIEHYEKLDVAVTVVDYLITGLLRNESTSEITQWQ
jgi:hypothetical protein